MTAAPERMLAPVQVSVAGHSLTIFAESPPLIAAMLEDIRAAQRRVWLETYIFLDDTAGRAIADALKQKARDGLDVRVQYDGIGSLTTPLYFFREMERAGARVHEYHSLWEAFWRFSFLRVLNRRNHRKLLIVDDRAGYFGGMNVVDATNRRVVETAEPLLWSEGWRDIHVRLDGPQVAELAESFDRSWKRGRGIATQARPKAYRQARLAGAEESIQLFDCGPGRGNTRASRVFCELIATARTSITFSMAYFLPVGRVLKELLRAQRRGVFIRAVVPGTSDVPVVQRASRHLYHRLLRRRFHIYERQQYMLHSKVMIVDNQWTVVGSANLDPRSLSINREFIAVIRSRPLAAVMNDIVRFEIAHSRRMTLREVSRWGCWQRFLDRLAWSFRWWL